MLSRNMVATQEWEAVWWNLPVFYRPKTIYSYWFLLFDEREECQTLWRKSAVNEALWRKSLLIWIPILSGMAVSLIYRYLLRANYRSKVFSCFIRLWSVIEETAVKKL